jgi:hypothetical protein
MKTKLFCFLIMLYSNTTVSAQDNHASLRQEKVFLHTDRNIYMAGENLFYTVYLQGNPGQTSKYVYLVLRDFRSVHVAELRIEIINGSAFGNISLSDTLRTGIYQIVSYTNCMRNNSEETYFNKEIIIANRFDETMERISESESTASLDSSNGIRSENIFISLDKTVYDPKEKISFSIKGMDLTESSEARLSVAVSEVVPGFNPENDISEYPVDNLLVPAKPQSNKSYCQYFSEINGPVLQGRIKFSSANSSVDSASLKNDSPNHKYTILVSTPDSLVNMQFTKTDSSGAFSMLLNRFYDGKELIIRTKENVKATVIPDNKYSLNTPFTPTNSLIRQGIRATLLRSGKIAQIRKLYNQNVIIETERVFKPSAIVPQLYYDIYPPIYPADYVSLNDFAEISKEIIPALRIRKTRDRYFAEYPGLQYLSPEGSEPEIFLDGVPIDDINQVIALGSDQISRIESLPDIRYFGDITFSGILAVFSRGHKISNINFTNPVLHLEALSSQPYTRPVLFSTNTINKHNPDVRQLLLWDPEVILKSSEVKQIDLFASDLEGLFRIDIHGVTSEGKPVHGSAVITVKSKSE